MSQNYNTIKPIKLSINPDKIRNIENAICKYGYHNINDFIDDSIRYYIQYLNKTPINCLSCNPSRMIMKEFIQLNSEMDNFINNPNSWNKEAILERIHKIYEYNQN